MCCNQLKRKNPFEPCVCVQSWGGSWVTRQSANQRLRRIQTSHYSQSCVSYPRLIIKHFARGEWIFLAQSKYLIFLHSGCAGGLWVWCLWRIYRNHRIKTDFLNPLKGRFVSTEALAVVGCSETLQWWPLTPAPAHVCLLSWCSHLQGHIRNCVFVECGAKGQVSRTGGCESSPPSAVQAFVRVPFVWGRLCEGPGPTTVVSGTSRRRQRPVCELHPNTDGATHWLSDCTDQWALVWSDAEER